jgi:hypothetical protein
MAATLGHISHTCGKWKHKPKPHGAAHGAKRSKQQHFAISRHASLRGGFLFRSPLFEIALVVVCLNHVASFIVNANHSIM